MSDTSIERWRGGVDEKLRGHGDDIRELREKATSNSTRIGVLEVTVGKLAVKLGVAAAIGSIVGGGIVAALAQALFHH